VKLIRVSDTGKATFGVLLSAGVPFAVTLERTWADNRKGESCIPKGTYTCKRVNSPKFGDTFEVTDVAGRSHILFHSGNIAADTHGCIIVAEAFNRVSGEDGITASREGFAEFKERTRSVNAFQLEIV